MVLSCYAKYNNNGICCPGNKPEASIGDSHLGNPHLRTLLVTILIENEITATCHQICLLLIYLKALPTSFDLRLSTFIFFARALRAFSWDTIAPTI